MDGQATELHLDEKRCLSFLVVLIQPSPVRCRAKEYITSILFLIGLH